MLITRQAKSRVLGVERCLLVSLLVQVLLYVSQRGTLLLVCLHRAQSDGTDKEMWTLAPMLRLYSCDRVYRYRNSLASLHRSKLRLLQILLDQVLIARSL